MGKKIVNWLCALTVAAIAMYAAWQFLFIAIYGILTGQLF